MTQQQSEAEKAANLFYGELTKRLWAFSTITSQKDSFLAGAKWMLEQADKLASKPSPTSATQFHPFVHIYDLQQLLRPK